MGRIKTRKCLHCQDFFQPDPRNKKRQHFCTLPDCRKASKKTAQARWLAKPENRDYFRGPSHVARIQAWRKKHPRYWKSRSKPDALQDVLTTQPVETKEDSDIFMGSPLQDILNNQPLVLIGLIARFTGLALQDDIAKTTHSLKQLGADILNRGTDHAFSRTTTPKDPHPIQLA